MNDERYAIVCEDSIHIGMVKDPPVLVVIYAGETPPKGISTANQ